MTTKSEKGLLWPDNGAKQQTSNPLPLNVYTDGVISALAGYLQGRMPNKRKGGSIVGAGHENGLDGVLCALRYTIGQDGLKSSMRIEGLKPCIRMQDLKVSNRLDTLGDRLWPKARLDEQTLLYRPIIQSGQMSQ